MAQSVPQGLDPLEWAQPGADKELSDLSQSSAQSMSVPLDFLSLLQLRSQEHPTRAEFCNPKDFLLWNRKALIKMSHKQEFGNVVLIPSHIQTEKQK